MLIERLGIIGGIVKGDPNSLVAISFLEEEIMGIIATDKGNWNLTFDKPSNQHICITIKMWRRGLLLNVTWMMRSF